MTTNLSTVLETRDKVKELKQLKSCDAVIILLGLLGSSLSFVLALVIYNIGGTGLAFISLIPSFLTILCGLLWGTCFQNHINKLEHEAVAVKALDALETKLPTMLNRAANGSQGYVSDLTYKLLSKWLKLEHPDGNHAHLREYVLATQIGLALIALHHPSLMCLGEDGLPEGRFSFENVRDMGPCSLKWKLSEDGKFTLRLDHPNPKGGAGWGTVIA